MIKKSPNFKIAAIGCIFAITHAQGAIWDGGGGTPFWSTDTNWDDDAAANGTAVIDNGDTTIRFSGVTVNKTDVNGGSTLELNGNSHSDSLSGSNVRNYIGNGSAGTVKHQGNAQWDIGHMLSIGNGTGGNGSYSLLSGTLTVFRDGNAMAGSPVKSSLAIGTNGGTGILDISRGTLNTRAGVEIGAGGTFQIMGTGDSQQGIDINIGSNGSLDGFWWQTAGGTLSMGIGADGVEQIFVDNVDDDGGQFATFADGSILDMSFYDTVATPGTWTLMELEGAAITDEGLELAAGDEAAGWSFTVDNSGPNGLLTVTYVPEPSSTALLGLGGLALLMRRRK
ncbi:PEP-CTERM sorting domain-containing protein [Oceaniferula flava]|uniref:PEP-CTERM sorting domain-containing protein n=1 Tax=Oceaniferula flava TaxID=2800421 RepID=UPI002867CCBE|nr:PEP-CTERM sorting domain-containing protein [Oceaniferula flavus]